MKSYREIADSVFERRDRYVAAQKKKKQRLMRASASVGSCALVALMGFELVNSSWFRHEPAVIDRVVHPSSTAPGAEVTTDSTETIPTNITTVPTQPDDTGGTQGTTLVPSQSTVTIPSTQTTASVTHNSHDTEASTTHSNTQGTISPQTQPTATQTITTGIKPTTTETNPTVTKTTTSQTKPTATKTTTGQTKPTATKTTTDQTKPTATKTTTSQTKPTVTQTTTSQTKPTATKTTISQIRPTTTQTQPTASQTQPTATQPKPTQTTVTTQPTITDPSGEDPVEPLPPWPYLWIIYESGENYANGEVPIYFKLEGFEEVDPNWVKETSYTANGFSIVGDITVEREAETGAIIYRMVLAYDGVTPKPSFFFSVVTADGMKQTDGLYGYSAPHGFFVSHSYDSAFSSSYYYLVKTGVITHDEYQAIMEKYWSESVNGSMSWS